MNLYEFIVESNEIEGIFKSLSVEELETYEFFLTLNKIDISSIEIFVNNICGKCIRDRPGMNVIVGSYMPPAGGPDIPKLLNILISKANNLEINSFKFHNEYEKLHSFMDGNGRSGRAIWAWMRLKENRDPFQLGFLHSFYYESLENYR